MPSGGNSLCRCWDFLLSLLPDVPLGMSPGASVPVAGRSLLCQPRSLTGVPVPLLCQVLQRSAQRVPDSTAAAGQDSPGAERLAYFAAHVSAHPSCPAPARAASAEDARPLPRSLSFSASVFISANMSKNMYV